MEREKDIREKREKSKRYGERYIGRERKQSKRERDGERVI